MKFTAVTILSVATIALAQKGGGKGGRAAGVNPTGPYEKSTAYWTEPGLPKNTIFAPKDVPNVKLPVLIWGNGGCSGNGLLFQKTLTEIASYGILVIAAGTPGGSGMTSQLGNPKAEYQLIALDWVTKNAGKGKWANVDASRIAAGGQSCGGLEALALARDPRVKYLGIFNSGQLNTHTIAPKISKPIFYFLGGKGDVAMPNGNGDYKVLPSSTPRWKGIHPKHGHMDSWSQSNGGDFGKAGRELFRWLLRGEQASSQYFLGGGAKADGWQIETAGLDKIQVTPIR